MEMLFKIASYLPCHGRGWASLSQTCRAMRYLMLHGESGRCMHPDCSEADIMGLIFEKGHVGAIPHLLRDSRLRKKYIANGAIVTELCSMLESHPESRAVEPILRAYSLIPPAEKSALKLHVACARVQPRATIKMAQYGAKVSPKALRVMAKDWRFMENVLPMVAHRCTSLPFNVVMSIMNEYHGANCVLNRCLHVLVDHLGHLADVNTLCHIFKHAIESSDGMLARKLCDKNKSWTIRVPNLGPVYAYAAARHSWLSLVSKLAPRSREHAINCIKGAIDTRNSQIIRLVDSMYDNAPLDYAAENILDRAITRNCSDTIVAVIVRRLDPADVRMEHLLKLYKRRLGKSFVAAMPLLLKSDPDRARRKLGSILAAAVKYGCYDPTLDPEHFVYPIMKEIGPVPGTTYLAVCYLRRTKWSERGGAEEKAKSPPSML